MPLGPVIRLLLEQFGLMALALAAILAAAETLDPTPPTLLVQADYQRCIPIKPGPIVAPKLGIGGVPKSEIS